MTPQQKLKRNLKPCGLFNLNYIEQNVGLRRYKLYAFVNGKEKLTDEQALSVLTFIKAEAKLK
jgi:hypothetical protein